MLTFYVVPVGASLYGHIQRQGPEGSLPSLGDLSPLSPEEVGRDAAATAALDRFKDWARQALAGGDRQVAMGLSAELNTLLRHWTGEGSAQALLLPSDTALGAAVADILREVLDRYGMSASTELVAGLAAKDDAKLGEGLRALAEALVKPEVPKRGSPNCKVVYALSGGFKVVQGFLQALGTVLADECIYVHDTANTLLRIPALPLSLDVSLTPEQQLAVRRDLAGLPVTPEALGSLPASLVYETEVAGERLVGLSAYGKALLSGKITQAEESALLPPLGVKVAFDPRFPKTCEGLPADRLRQVNRQLARLAAALERDQDPGQSVDLKPLKGRGHPRGTDATHEIDAWADQDARRIFGTLVSGVFTAIALDKGLH